MTGKKMSKETRSHMSKSHKKLIPHPNSLKNLKFGYKISEEQKQYLREINSGENNPTHIYSDEQILKAKKLLDEGMKQIDVAKQLNMGKSTIGRIARGETRKNILD